MTSPSELVGDAEGTQTGRHTASRWFAHTDVAKLAKVAIGTGPATIADVLGQPAPALVRIADTFLSLQAERHRARTLRDDGDRSYRRFLRLMVGAVQIAKNR